MLFWTLAALLAVMAIAFFVIPFYRANGGDEEAVGSVQRSENLLLFAERESELAEDLAAGEIDSEEHATLLRELQQSLFHFFRQGFVVFLFTLEIPNVFQQHQICRLFKPVNPVGH